MAISNAPVSESGTGPANEGRIYEELILRDPPIGYSLFHLQAMALVASMAEIHEGGDLWSFEGSDGGGIEDAYDRYGDYVLGLAVSPAPHQEPDLTFYSWLYEFAFARWSKDAYVHVLNTTNRLEYRIQCVGPTSLVVGEELPF